VDKQISEDGEFAICPFCGHKQQIKRMPLFIISGPSGAGKSTTSSQLFLKEKDYIVLDSDILWSDEFNEPETNYIRFRELWLRLCKNISQIGKPVVLCGCAVPEQFENCIERRYFSDIYYLAVVCEDDVLEKRLREHRNIKDEAYIKDCVSFNRWLKANADNISPKMQLLDNSRLTIEEAAKLAEEWIYKYI